MSGAIFNSFEEAKGHSCKLNLQLKERGILNATEHVKCSWAEMPLEAERTLVLPPNPSGLPLFMVSTHRAPGHLQR